MMPISHAGKHRRDQVDDQKTAHQQGQQAERTLRQHQRIHLCRVHMLPGTGRRRLSP
jgi:hypothetical protein